MVRSNALRVAVAALALLALSGASAPRRDGEAVPPPAPPLRFPGGEVMMSSSFHSESSLERWTPDRHGVWTLAHGALRAQLPDKKQARSFIYAGSEDWGAYAVDVDVCQTRGVDKGVVVRARGGRGVGVDLRGPGYHDVLLHLQDSRLGRAAIRNDNDVWHHIRIEALDSRYKVYVDGRLLIDQSDPRKATRHGRIALAAYTGGDGKCTVYYDNVVVTALR